MHMMEMVENGNMLFASPPHPPMKTYIIIALVLASAADGIQNEA